MRTRPLYDVVALLARLGVGIVFMAHGWQKIEAGVTATSRSFDSLGVPLPTAAAVYSAFVELLGGAALIAGLGLPVTGVLLFLDMAGAFIFVHADKGLFMVDGKSVQNGYELVVALGLAGLLFAAGGGGRLTVDQWVIAKRLRRPAEKEDEDDAASFVESLRQAELKPAKKPRRSSKPPAVPAPESSGGPDKPADTSDDVLVAGRRKSSQRRRTSTTQPTKPPTGDTDPPA
ncbi:DoxX family protein [Spirillospora sp. NPDC049024]